MDATRFIGLIQERIKLPSTLEKTDTTQMQGMQQKHQQHSPLMMLMKKFQNCAKVSMLFAGSC